MAIAFKTLKILGIAKLDSDHIKVLEVLERQHQKLTRTVERVLDSAIPFNNKTKHSIDINSLLQGYQNYSMSEDHNATIQTGDRCNWVIGTQSLIEGAIDNLLDNAVKYSSRGSEIIISGVTENDRYRVDITDSGKGIPAVFQNQLFDKFFRVPEKDLHSVRGLGLGLYLSRQAVRSIGGELVLSRSSETGSTFTIYLSIA
jgi:two-component system phosphate regulon sensor histidine kinase PhoR